MQHVPVFDIIFYYLSLARAAPYSAIVLDVDSKDVSAGMSSPPTAFVEPSFLTAARSLLTDQGQLNQVFFAPPQAIGIT